jgi:hypothetical protein
MAIAAGAQSQKISLPSTRMSVLGVFNEIQKQARFGMAYRTNQLDLARMLTFPATTTTVDEAMQTAARATGTGYEYENKMIILTKAVPVVAPRRETPPMVVAAGYVPTDMNAFDKRTRRSVAAKTTAASAPTGAGPAPKPTPEPVAAPAWKGTESSSYRPSGSYSALQGELPRFALKANLPYGLATLTPNLAFEVAMAKKWTFDLDGSYHPWRLKGSMSDNKKLVHMIIKPEFRYWLCERFDGHFFGLHGIYGRYNIGTYDIPLLFEKEYRYNGHAVGAGITYGYHMSLHKRWGLEFALGAGFMWLKYDRFDCAACNRDAKPMEKWYFGPTNAAINLVFLIK